MHNLVLKCSILRNLNHKVGHYYHFSPVENIELVYLSGAQARAQQDILQCLT